MSYQEAFKILDLESLNGFVNKTKSLALTPSEGIFTGDPEGYMDPEFYWKITVEAIGKLGWSLQDIGAKIYLLAWGIRDIVKAWWHNLSLILFKRARDWWDHFLETFKGLAYDISYSFKKFVQDPAKFIYEKVRAAVSDLIEGIRVIGVDIGSLAMSISQTVLSGILTPLFTIQKALAKINEAIGRSFSSYWNRFLNTINGIIQDIVAAVRSAIADLPIAFQAPTQTIKNWIDDAKNIVVKTFDYGLGGLINTFKDFLGGIFDRIWNWFVGLLNKVATFINQNVILPLWNIVKGAWNWLVSWFTSLWQEVKNFLFSLHAN